MDVHNKTGFPFEFHELDPETASKIPEYFKGSEGGFVLVGPKRYCMPRKYKEQAADLYNMPLRKSDVFIVTYPRSGTTFTSELIWLVANDLDFGKAAATPLGARFPFVEFPVLIGPEEVKFLLDFNKNDIERINLLVKPGAQTVATLPSPRFIKSHLPLSLLPPDLLDTAKVVYVARNPKDVAVSHYHVNKLFKILSFSGDFKDYWNLFSRDIEKWSPFFEHIKEAWEKRHHPNMLFLFYENLVKDLPGGIRRVAEFFEKQLTEQQIEQLCEHLSFDNFKKNKSVNDTIYKELGFVTDYNQSFIRKGKAGGWRDYFDEEMMEQAERWIADNLRDTDLRFPE